MHPLNKCLNKGFYSHFFSEIFFFNSTLDLIFALKAFLNLGSCCLDRVTGNEKQIEFFNPAKSWLLYSSSKFCLKTEQFIFQFISLLPQFIFGSKKTGDTSSILSRALPSWITKFLSTVPTFYAITGHIIVIFKPLYKKDLLSSRF